MATKQATTLFLIAVAAVALYLCYRIAQPFLNAIFAAIVLAIVFYPLHSRIESSLRRPNAAATISTLLVMLIVSIPALLLAVAATKELGELYRTLSAKSAAQGGLSLYLIHLMEGPTRLVGRYVDLSRLDLRSSLLGWVNQASRYLLRCSSTRRVWQRGQPSQVFNSSAASSGRNRAARRVAPQTKAAAIFEEGE